MGKFVAGGLNGKAARVGRPGQWLTITLDETIADLGIWFTYGAWFGHQEIAIEPQSGPGDHLGQTIEAGAPPLVPGQTRTWRVQLTVGA
jgi:galactose mutarotase-like enzyme